MEAVSTNAHPVDCDDLELALQGTTNVFELATRLLAVADHAKASRFGIRDHDVFEAALDDLQNSSPYFLPATTASSPDARSVVIANLRSHGTDLPRTALALAWAIDEVFNEHFLDCYRSMPAGSLEDGNCVPIGDLPWIDLVGASNLSVAPEKRTDAPRTPHLAIFRAQRESKLDVALEVLHGAGLSSTLDRLRSSGAVGMVYPIADVGDLALDTFPYGPADGDAASASLLTQLGHLAAASPPVVVAPELNLAADSQGLVESYLLGRPPGQLVVLSSVHTRSSGAPKNETDAWLTGSTVRLSHAKINPYGSWDDGFEPIDPSRRLTVWASGDWRLGLLICKDLLDPEVIHALSQLQVDLVLVPALSPKTDDMVIEAQALARRAQAVVLVANGPTSGWQGRPEPVPVVVATPWRGQAETLDQVQIPGAALFNLADGRKISEFT